MKVCVINSLYAPYQRGGAEVVAASEVANLAQAGREVFVISIKPWQGVKSLWPSLEEASGVRVYRFYPLNIFSFININKWPAIFRLKWLFWDMFNLHSYLVVKSILKKERPDEVRTHNCKGLGYLTWWAIRRLGLKNIHTLHDVQLVAPSGLLKFGEEGKLNGWFYKSYAAICRVLVGSPAEVVSPSRWLLDFYTSRGFFKNSKQIVNLAFGALPIVKKLNLRPQKEVINLLYVGQIEEHKGILWLVEKLKSGLTNFPTSYKLQAISYHLDIVGDGSKLEIIKQLVAGDERFKVWGRVASDKRDEFFDRTDFTVVPSLVYENAPTIIGQSLKHDVPVLASKIGGIPELVAVGENGRLFSPKNFSEFSAFLSD